jgi:hypothetical protein
VTLNPAVKPMVCRTCGEIFPGLVAIRAHHRAVHGLGSGGAAGGTPDPRPRVRERGRRRIESVTGAPDASLPSEPSAADDRPDDAPAPRPAPSRPSINAPTIHISPEARAQSVSDAVRDAMPLPMLADLIRTLSVAVSEADGAGEAGYLSPIQSTQVAVLLYDSTVDLVVGRFKGDVSRFKAGLAVIVILASKGGVHGRAIRDKARARMAQAEHDAIMASVTDEDSELSPIDRALRLQTSRAYSNDEGIVQ